MKITKKFINKAIFLTSMSDIAFILLIFIVIVSLIGQENRDSINLPYSNKKSKYDNKPVNIFIYENFIRINEKKITKLNKSNIKNILSQYDKLLSVKIFADRNILFFKVKRIIKIINELKFNKFEFAID